MHARRFFRYEMKATVLAGAFVRASEERTPSTVLFSTLVCLAPAAEVKWSTRLKRLLFDVLVKTLINALHKFLARKKETEAAVVSGEANTSPAPALTALNIFNALNWKNESPALMR